MYNGTSGLQGAVNYRIIDTVSHATDTSVQKLYFQDQLISLGETFCNSGPLEVSLFEL